MQSMGLPKNKRSRKDSTGGEVPKNNNNCEGEEATPVGVTSVEMNLSVPLQQGVKLAFLCLRISLLQHFQVSYRALIGASRQQCISLERRTHPTLSGLFRLPGIFALCFHCHTTVG